MCGRYAIRRSSMDIISQDYSSFDTPGVYPDNRMIRMVSHQNVPRTYRERIRLCKQELIPGL